MAAVVSVVIRNKKPNFKNVRALQLTYLTINSLHVYLVLSNSNENTFNYTNSYLTLMCVCVTYA